MARHHPCNEGHHNISSRVDSHWIHAALPRCAIQVPRGAEFRATWLFQLPALLVERGTLPVPRERVLPLVVLGFFAPALFAIALSTLEGRAARRELWKPLTLWRVHPGWHAAALGLPCAIFVAMRALAAAVGGSELGPWLYPPAQPQQLAAMLIIPFTEQIPWRGYVYPRLQRTHGAQLASMITGFAWGL